MSLDFEDTERMELQASTREFMLANFDIEPELYDQIFDFGFRLGKMAKTIENIEYLEGQIDGRQ